MEDVKDRGDWAAIVCLTGCSEEDCNSSME